MSKLFSDNTIENRVMLTVRRRIVAAQGRYDTGCKKIDEEKEKEKSFLAEKLVEEVLGKAA